ncbi:MAG: hypothetical protein ICCCNLDF_01007 [Planctomycetes bacterium]|nr:hypothetical protein [Planctomycetota bacterium]
MKSIALLLGIPLTAAALLAAFTFTWNSFAGNPTAVHADGAGVDNAREGYALNTVKVGDIEYLVVSSYMPFEGEKKEELKGTPRHFVTIYEIVRKSEGKAELILIGSRCVEWDRGYELINFKADGSSPTKLRGTRD